MTFVEGNTLDPGQKTIAHLKLPSPIFAFANQFHRDLAALGGSKNFEETLIALGAAVQLLGSRVALGTAEAQLVKLPTKPKPVDKAA